MYSARVRPAASTVFACAALAGVTPGCNATSSAADLFDGGPPLSDASCPVACGSGQVCQFPGAIGAVGDTGPSLAASCQSMPDACGGNENCGCLWLALCGGSGVGISCSYNPMTGGWIAQCIAQ